MTVADFFSTAQAYASAAAEAEHHTPSINDIWFPLINFLIYAFIIVKFALPLIRDFLKTRREEIVAKGMGALAAVAQGSYAEPQLIVIRYDGGGSSPHLGFVGKAVTFDSGGISIKPAGKMH